MVTIIRWNPSSGGIIFYYYYLHFCNLFLREWLGGNINTFSLFFFIMFVPKMNGLLLLYLKHLRHDKFIKDYSSSFF